jgi:hypothetical protein
MGVKPNTPDELAAKQAIHDVICRYSRAVDRLDMDLLISCWHPGGIDSRPPIFHGTVDEFARWIKPLLSKAIHTTHNVMNTLIDLRGDEAGVETYWAATLRVSHGGDVYDVVRGGRYLDKFTRINGLWAMEIRRSITDWSRIEKFDRALVEALLSNSIPSSSELPAEKAARDRSDPSYGVLSLS